MTAFAQGSRGHKEDRADVVPVVRRAGRVLERHADLRERGHILPVQPDPDGPLVNLAFRRDRSSLRVIDLNENARARRGDGRPRRWQRRAEGRRRQVEAERDLQGLGEGERRIPGADEQEVGRDSRLLRRVERPVDVKLDLRVCRDGAFGEPDR